MTELERYLAEEIAEDHVDGIITRREAMRRLGAAGRRRDRGGGDDHGGGRRAHARQEQRRRRTRPRSWPWPRRTARSRRGRRWRRRRSRSPARAGTCMGAWAPPRSRGQGRRARHPREPGLTPTSQRGRPLRRQRLFARSRSTCSPRRAGRARSRRGGAHGQAVGVSADPKRFDEDMKAALTEIGKRVCRQTPISAIGFCFGGGMIWRLLVAKERRLSAAAPFYGPFPTGGDCAASRPTCSASSPASTTA